MTDQDAGIAELERVLAEGLRLGIPGQLRAFIEQRIETLKRERDRKAG